RLYCFLGGSVILVLSLTSLNGRPTTSKIWVSRGFTDFAKGQFEDGGSNLYVNANGIMEMIHRWDVNNDGYPDLILANSHDYIERGPTRIFWPTENAVKSWKRQELTVDSGWMSRIVDLDKDGYPDL